MGCTSTKSIQNENIDIDIITNFKKIISNLNKGLAAYYETIKAYDTIINYNKEILACEKKIFMGVSLDSGKQNLLSVNKKLSEENKMLKILVGKLSENVTLVGMHLEKSKDSDINLLELNKKFINKDFKACKKIISLIELKVKSMTTLDKSGKLFRDNTLDLIKRKFINSPLPYINLPDTNSKYPQTIHI
jgi:hypothetical protein